MPGKAELRRVYLEKRLFLPDEEFEIRCKLVRDNFLKTFPPDKFSSMHVFLPIIEKKEVNTWLIIHEYRKLNPDLKIYISKTRRDGSLEHYLLEEETRLRVSPWGIPEPDGHDPVVPEHIDVVLIPLIISDKAGNRIGYGKGYYDRFLREIPSDNRVGLTLSPPLDEIQFAEDHDVPLTACIGPYLCEFF